MYRSIGHHTEELSEETPHETLLHPNGLQTVLLYPQDCQLHLHGGRQRYSVHHLLPVELALCVSVHHLLVECHCVYVFCVCRYSAQCCQHSLRYVSQHFSTGAKVDQVSFNYSSSMYTFPATYTTIQSTQTSTVLLLEFRVPLYCDHRVYQR